MSIEPLGWLADVSPDVRDQITHWLTESEKAEFQHYWRLFARPAQLPPSGDWRYWLIMAGRGFGKTRAGAEWVRTVAEEDPNARIALVSSSLAEARAVMVEGESGIIACSPPDRAPVFESSLRRLRFPNGALATIYSAGEPESLRGPQNSHAWCDEIGKWPLAHERATQCWDNLLLGLRLGSEQRVVATTTPRSVPLIHRLVDAARTGSCVVTRGTTLDNAGNLPRRFIEAVESEFCGSLLARQELDGELVSDIEGALWNRALIERCRDAGTEAAHIRVVVAVDPPASAHGNACGIVVAALGRDGIGHVLADCSVERASPIEGEAWLVTATAQGDWLGHEDDIAAYIGARWLFAAPTAGMRVHSMATNQFKVFNGNWQSPSEPSAPSGGATIDVEARATISELIEVLRVGGLLPPG